MKDPGTGQKIGIETGVDLAIETGADLATETGADLAIEIEVDLAIKTEVNLAIGIVIEEIGTVKIIGLVDAVAIVPITGSMTVQTKGENQMIAQAQTLPSHRTDQMTEVKNQGNVGVTVEVESEVERAADGNERREVEVNQVNEVSRTINLV